MKTSTVEAFNALVNVSIVYDGEFKTGEKPRGEIIGIYGIPPAGGWSWYATNGDWGDGADDEAECRREIVAARERG